MEGIMRRRCRTPRRVSRLLDAGGIRAPPGSGKQVCAVSQAFEKGESKTQEIGGQYMSGDVQLELWLHEYKMEALSAVLEQQGISVEKQMQDRKSTRLNSSH